jgi:hypothetical protein
VNIQSTLGIIQSTLGNIQSVGCRWNIRERMSKATAGHTIVVRKMQDYSVTMQDYYVTV